MNEFTPTPIDDLLGDAAPFTDDDLDLYLTEPDTTEPNGDVTDTHPTVRVGRFRIDGPKTARWAIAKLRLHTARRAEIAAMADDWREPLIAELQRVNEWETAEMARPERSISYFTGLLEQWAIESRTDDTKSFKLPGGTVSTRESKPKFEIADMAAAVTYAAGHNLGVKTTTSITDLKPAVVIVDRIVYVDGHVVPHAATRWVATHSAYDIEFAGADPNEGAWVAVDPATGEVLDPETTTVAEGPFAVDADTGLPIEGLKAVPGTVTATVTLT